MKNILLLINGFGIESANSYSIYSADNMPNIDRLTHQYLFSSISNSFYNYKEAYRKFSMGINEDLTYSVVENDILSDNYKTNNNFNNIISNTIKNKGNIHIFCYYQNNKTINSLTKYIEIINNSKVKCFIHLILCQNNLDSYKNIERKLSLLNYEYEYIKLGIIVGYNYFYNNSFVNDIDRSLLLNQGEKWSELDKKISVLKETKTIPNNVRCFIVSSNSVINNNDSILLFNYFRVDDGRFNTLFSSKYKALDKNTISLSSLFYINESIPFMYNYAVSTSSFFTSLKSINSSAVIVDKKDNTPYINYYLTGLSNKNVENIKYVFSDNIDMFNINNVLSIINSINSNLIILNYDISNECEIENLTFILNKIDVIIGVLEKESIDKGYTLFISSLFGINKDLKNKAMEIHNVNFSNKLPLIIVDKKYNNKKYLLNDGNLYDLSNTILKNINNDFKSKSLIKNKSGLLKFLYK